MDIPTIDNAVFLIDRKDLDAQTTMAFQVYANNDLVDVDETDNVNDLKKKLRSGSRQVIVTTIQKLQRLITKRLQEDTPDDGEGDATPEERQKKIGEIRKYVEELHRDNLKIADIMSGLIDEIETDAEKYRGKSILNIVENMKQDCIDQVVTDFCLIWYASKYDVMYAASYYRNGEIPNESRIKATVDYTGYKEAQKKPSPSSNIIRR